MDKKIVPVVFSTNDNYALYCYIAISSLIKVADSEKIYDIKVFVTRLSEKYCKLLESLTQGNIKVECMDITSIVQNADLRELSFFSVETFYRLFISLVLNKYEKVIYIDSDMVILNDVSKLLDCDLRGHAIGCVHDVQCSHLEWHCNDMGAVDYKRAFNAGLLVIDTKAYEEQNIRDVGLKLLVDDYKNERRKFIYVDQDVLNSVLEGEVEYLDDRWNFQWQYVWRMDMVYEPYDEIYLQVAEEPWIIHYAGDRKPWAYPELPNAHYFWDVAKDTVVYEDIVQKSIIDNRSDKTQYNCFDVFKFPYELVPAQSRIAIYAAGAVGKAFYEQLKLTKYSDLVLWVDQKYEKIESEFLILAPDMLIKKKDDYQYIIVAIEDGMIAKSVQENLVNMGIPKEKIVWKIYRE